MNALQTDCAPTSRRFSKERRIRRRAEFKEAFTRGARLHSRYLTAVLLPNGRSLPRLGLVTSRKFGNSVERNRAKRLIREMFRAQFPLAGSFGADLVIIPRRQLLDVPFSVAQKDFQDVWSRAAERIAREARKRGTDGTS